MRPWDGIISEDEQRAYGAAGFGLPAEGAGRPDRFRPDLEPILFLLGRRRSSERQPACGQDQAEQMSSNQLHLFIQKEAAGRVIVRPRFDQTMAGAYFGESRCTTNRAIR